MDYEIRKKQSGAGGGGGEGGEGRERETVERVVSGVYERDPVM